MLSNEIKKILCADSEITKVICENKILWKKYSWQRYTLNKYFEWTQEASNINPPRTMSFNWTNAVKGRYYDHSVEPANWNTVVKGDAVAESEEAQYMYLLYSCDSTSIKYTEIYRMTRKLSKGEPFGIATSSNINEYPQDGPKGNFWYVFVKE